MRFLVTGLALIANVIPAAADEDFDRRVIEAILANPEVVLLAVEKLKEREDVTRTAGQRDRIRPVEGELFVDDAVRVVEFIDYRCGFCAQNAAIIGQLSQSSRSKVRFLEFPILGEASSEISEVALAVRNTSGDEAYRAFHFAVFESSGRVSGRESALALAASQGLDATVLSEVSKSLEVREEIDRNRVLARRLGITGTPAFVTRERIHEGLMDVADLRGILEPVNSTATGDE